jgi:hypothetical protein
MGLMKQMKTGVDITSTTTNIEVNTNNSDKQEQIQVPKFECVLPDKMNDQLERINNTLLLIVDKISAIESEIQTLKECKQRSKSDADSEFNEEHIVLKIEEKDIYVKTVVDNLTLDDEADASEADASEADASVEEDPDVSEASEEVDASVEEDPDVNLEVVEAEEEVEAEEDPVVNLEAVVVVNLEDEEVASVAEDDSEKEISDESESEEEEVASEADASEADASEADASEADEDTVVNLDVKEEQPVAAVEEEEEEVFEIEIDDITYYATHEENGILYEVDKDGEVGKKVGIIKDGEPIFS